MRTVKQPLTHSACAVAVAVMLAACGGGDLSTDKTPPTATIAAAANGANVIFSFTFNEDVGTSFKVEDVAVTGGTAGLLTKVDATNYTLIVTPGGTGAVTVNVAAAKFNDLANNPNTAAASGTYTPSSSAPATVDFSGTSIALDAFEGLVSAEITNDPTDATNKVAKFVKGPSGQPWAGATLYTCATDKSVAAADLAANKTVTLRVYSGASIGTKISLKLENAAAPGENIGAEATTTKQNAWETLSFNFAAPTTGVVSPTAKYNKISIFPAFRFPDTSPKAPTADTSFFFDDLNYQIVASPATCAPPVAVTSPTIAAATPPTRNAADVVSIYSDAYAQVAGFNPRPDWGQTTKVEEVLIAANKTEKYTTLNYEGIEFASVDVSAMTKLHIDVWTPDLTSLAVSVISPGKENPVVLTPTKSGWNSFDIDMAQYTAADKTKVNQLKFEGTPAGGTLFFDNLYFYKASTTTTPPTGSETLSFSSGYTNPVDKGGYWEGSTAEAGAWGYYSGGFPTVSDTFTGGEPTYRYIGVASATAPSTAPGTYMGIYNLYKTGGLTLAGQTAISVELAADQGYIDSGKSTLRVDIEGAPLFDNGNVKDCRIVATGSVKVTTAALTSYSIPLTLGQACNQSSITSVAKVLTFPIGKVAVTADAPNVNATVKNADAKYVTAFTLGKITFTK